MPENRVLFRCNADHATGFGHVSRCLSVARELQQSAESICFALGSDDAVQRVQSRGFAAVVLSGADADAAFEQLVRSMCPSLLVLDVRPAHSEACLRAVRALVPTIAVIDDISHQRLFADHVFLPPTPTVKQLDWTDFKGQIHMGLEWMPLGDTFEPCPPNPWPGTGPRHLLMTMGGSDPWGYTMSLAPRVDAICRLRGGELGIVIGPGFAQRERQLEACASLPCRPRIFDCPAHMTEVYQWCHAAITVFGVTAYELAACARPALYVCPNADYKEHAGVFVAEGKGSIWPLASCSLAFLGDLLNETFMQRFAPLTNLGARSIANLVQL